MTVSILLLIVRNNLPGSPRYKVLSIMSEKLYWSTGIQIRNGYIYKVSRYMSLLLVSNIMDVCSLSIQLSKNCKLTRINITIVILVVLNCSFLKFFIGKTLILWNGEMMLWKNGEMVKLWYTEIMLGLNGETIWWSISVMCLCCT